MKCSLCGKRSSGYFCFDCAYSLQTREPEEETFGFNRALLLLKQGKKVKRKSWGGYWFLSEKAQVAERVEDGYVRSFSLNPTIFAVLKDMGGTVLATPYQEDLLAEDWVEVD